jgi:hypothetical protein
MHFLILSQVPMDQWNTPPLMGTLWSGPCQSPSRNIGLGSSSGTLLGIWGYAWGKDCFPCRQSIFQCPHCPHCEQDLVGGHGLGQDFAQCPGFPHQKQAWGGCLLGPLGKSFGPIWSIWFWRIEANIWYFVQVFLSLNCLASSFLLLKTLKAILI